MRPIFCFLLSGNEQHLRVMNQLKSGQQGYPSAMRQLGWVAFCLVLLLGFLFWEGLLPGHTVFSNDGPLGQMMAQCGDLPSDFMGFWHDLNWLGAAGPSAAPTISNTLSLVCGKVIFSKIYAPFSLLFLGLSAWLCFRQWKFSPLACALGGIAATLNSDFFSTACWGVATQPLCFGCAFLALAALADETSPKRWLRVALAGFAVGMGVMEAFDIGAIFSLAVAAFAVFQALADEGTMAKTLGRGIGRLAVVVLFSGFIAASAVNTLVSTQIKGVAGMGQDVTTKAQRWDEATQWSMPKGETLGIVVPGLYGFRMDTPDGGNYWGRCGRDAAWDRWFKSGKTEPKPDPRAHFLRYGGGGPYAGVIVVTLALWAILQSWRKEKSVFSLTERKFVWFWSGMALLCVLVGFGRFAPFYQFFYKLPFASTMRNPSKFYHVVEWILVILCAYGAHGLSRSCMGNPAATTRDLASQLKAWWVKAALFDKNWVRGSLIALVISLVGWWIYAASHERLVAYLQEVDFDQSTATAIASFSVRQVGWYILFLALGMAAVAGAMSGYFNGRRAKAGAILLSLLVAADLTRANTPWVVTWNWVRKYASNPVIEFLGKDAYEHRVAVLPFPVPQQFSLFPSYYNVEMLQQLFPYNNIQSLDQIMNPRPHEDEIAFRTALQPDRSTNSVYRILRNWELTNTRYLLGPTGFLDILNQQLDPGKQRFRLAATFAIEAKPGISSPTGYDELTTDMVTNGPYAVFEYTGALPRAKLYGNWQVSTNDHATLSELASAPFDPEQKVLVADSLPSPSSGAAADASCGKVDFVSYAPKDIVLKADATKPAVLLLNDRYDLNWKVSVDGKPEKVLRCNFLMRGVYLQPGSHTVEFRFAPRVDTLYVSLAAVAVAVLLLAYLAVPKRKEPVPTPRQRDVVLK
jgi:hypothetical protein